MSSISENNKADVIFDADSDFSCQFTERDSTDLTIRDSVRKFDESLQLSTKKNLLSKAYNLERSVENYAIKVIGRLIKGKKINDKKIPYDIGNEGLTGLRNQLTYFVSENKKQLSEHLNSFNNAKGRKAQKNFLFQSDFFKQVFLMIVELMFYPVKQNHLGFAEPDELQKKFKLNCCEGSHDFYCLDKWKSLKVALMNKVRNAKITVSGTFFIDIEGRECETDN